MHPAAAQPRHRRRARSAVRARVRVSLTLTLTLTQAGSRAVHLVEGTVASLTLIFFRALTLYSGLFQVRVRGRGRVRGRVRVGVRVRYSADAWRRASSVLP